MRRHTRGVGHVLEAAPSVDALRNFQIAPHMSRAEKLSIMRSGHVDLLQAQADGHRRPRKDFLEWKKREALANLGRCRGIRMFQKESKSNARTRISYAMNDIGGLTGKRIG